MRAEWRRVSDRMVGHLFRGAPVDASLGMPQSVTLWPSHTLRSQSTSAGAVAEAAADRKRRKYSSISGTHHFTPVAVETLGPICSEGTSFLSEIAEKLSRITGEQREKAFLFQRISVAIQRGNAAAFHGTTTSFSVNTLAI